MKKILLATLLSALVTSAFAAENAQSAQQETKQPSLIFSVFDLSNKVSRNLDTRTLSRSAKNQQLCWVAFNFPLGNEAKVVETFTSPENAQFMTQGAQVQVSENNTKHIITKEHVKTYNSEFVQSCWAFDKTDQIGDYSLQLSVDNVQFPATKFTITK